MVLLHGAASNSTRWWNLVGASKLGRDRALLRPDLRGHGASVWRGPACMDVWSDDLADLLREEGEAEAYVLGHCLGANLAVHFAARHPALARGLVLVEPMPQGALVGSTARLRTFAPLVRLAVTLVRAANKVGLRRRRFEALDLEALDRQVFETSGSAAARRGLIRRYGSPWHDLRTLPTAQYLQNLLELLRPLPLAPIRCPCLALLSKGRLMADPARTRLALRELGKLEIAEIQAQHWIPTEQPEALREQVDTWVTRQERQAPTS